MNTFDTAVLLGMASSALVVIFRAVPPGKALAATGRKPWACNICMSFWFTIITAILGFCFNVIPMDRLWAALPAYAVCLWLIGQVTVVDFDFGSTDKAKNEKDDENVR